MEPLVLVVFQVSPADPAWEFFDGASRACRRPSRAVESCRKTVRVPELLLGPLVLSLVGCIVPQAGPATGAPDKTPAASPSAPSGSDVMIFLLIGQSNMAGAPKPESQDQVENPRVRVLAYDDCPNLGQAYNQWYRAKPPLHDCDGGVGPGDYFGKMLADAYPNATIGLVPLGINGADIDMFGKGVISKRRGEFKIPPDNHWTGAYEWVIQRAELARRAGTIRGILFHQGESDTGNAAWVGKVEAIVENLRVDLRLGEAPFVAGELLYSGCCGKWHNPLVRELAREIGNTRVVSADGLSGFDAAHFDLPGQRELGARYGAAMLELLRPAATPAPAP